MVSPKHHIFVCTSSRINGTQQGYCYQQKGVSIVQAFLEEIDDRELSGDVMINNTGCFGICDKGPIVVIYPEGVWYGNVSPDDVERIMDEHIEGGTPVEDLLI
ncbi:2Fe-2S ferredoxin [Eubacteriaceae bacterium ES3]|nr:2Fe-2S ferredoxin [Eubacteriaceae bacterium ES3]